jgi:hypothetical protein
LQAVVQVWQPMHLFKSITMASWRFDIGFSYAFATSTDDS